MSTPHIEHFVDERGNFICRGEIGGTVLSEDEVKALGKYVSGILDENHRLQELVDELYPLADYGAMDASELDRAHDLMRELGIEVDE